MNGAGTAWRTVLDSASGVFTAPYWVLFADLLGAWVCCPTRRTITAMLTLIDPAERGAHDAYHRLVTRGVTFHVSRADSRRLLPEVLRLVTDGHLDPLAVPITSVDWQDAEQAWPSPATKLVLRR